MRNKRVEEIKKRIAKRKAEQEKREEDELFSFEEQEHTQLLVEKGEEIHPLFQKEIFLFKLLLSAILKNTTNSFEGTRTVVRQTMEKEFQFASVSKWYESQFGKPLAFLSSSDKKTTQKEKNYAVPASGKVMQGFQANGQGVFVQTAANAVVESVNEGIVISIAQKEGFGNTVEIKHADGTESWYGNLGETSVKLYDYVAKKQKVGTVANGKFYFAFKKNEKFIDPIQVISFE